MPNLEGRKGDPSTCTYLCPVLSWIQSCWRKQWLSHPILTNPFYSLHLITRETDFFLKGQMPYTRATSSAVKAVSAVRSSPCFWIEVQCSHYMLCTLSPLGIVSGFLSFSMSTVVSHTSMCLYDTTIWCLTHIMSIYLQSLHILLTLFLQLTPQTVHG